MERQPCLKTLVTLIAASIVATGCATPYVVKLPDEKPAPDGRSIAQALGYLDRTRETFREAVSGQIDDEHTATNAFIGAGALIAALALGKVNRNGILGATAVAGTGYALTSNNLPRTRLQIHQEAVKALNCVERAALPLAISDRDAAQLGKDVEALRGVQQRLFLALENARAARRAVPGADRWIAVFDAMEPNAVAMLEQIDRSLKAGGAFLDASASAAPKVVASVTEIRDAAVYLVGTTATPLAAVQSLVPGLARDFGAFAPGAGIDALLADPAKKAAGVASSKEGASSSALAVALTDLQAAQKAAMGPQAKVNALLRGRNTSFAEDAFKDCSIAQVVTALSASPTPLRFGAAVGGQRVLDISGGIKPYFLQLDGDPIAGLSFPTGPIRGGQAEIVYKAGAVSAGVKSGLRLSDSSPGGQGVRIEVEVTGPAVKAGQPAAPAAKTTQKPAAPAAGAGAGAAATPPGIDSVLAALTQHAKFRSGGVDFQRKDLPEKVGDRIQVTVLCPAGNTRVFQKAALAKSYLTDAQVGDFPVEKIVLSTQPSECAPS